MSKVSEAILAKNDVILSHFSSMNLKVEKKRLLCSLIFFHLLSIHVLQPTFVFLNFNLSRKIFLGLCQRKLRKRVGRVVDLLCEMALLLSCFKSLQEAASLWSRKYSTSLWSNLQIILSWTIGIDHNTYFHDTLAWKTISIKSRHLPQFVTPIVLYLKLLKV